MADIRDIIISNTPTADELEASKPEFLPEDDWLETNIDGDWLNPEDEWERAKNALYIKDAPICALGGLTILTGQSGHGKTMTIAMIAGSIFRGEYGTLKRGSEIENPSVLYVDTEMEKYNTQRLVSRIYSITGWEFRVKKEEFNVLRLRDTVDAASRWKKVLRAIYETRPTFCILDGLIDLVRDFNDNVECQNLIYKLMHAASHYNMSVIGVIHQNPGGEKMAGHLGSFGERKAITTLVTKKDKSSGSVIFTVEQKKARDKDADNLKFFVNDDSLHIGIPEPYDECTAQPQSKYGSDTIRNWIVEASHSGMSEPFSLTDLRTMIKGVSGIGYNVELDIIIQTAKNNQFIRKQPESERVKGCKHPKWYFNIEDKLPY